MKGDNKLFQPIEFWSGIVKLMDGRIQQISTTYGFGEVNVTLRVRHGKVSHVIFNEQLTVKQPTGEEYASSKETKENTS